MRLLALLAPIGLALFLPVYLASRQMSEGTLISDSYLAGFIFIEVMIFLIQQSDRPKPKLSLTVPSPNSVYESPTRIRVRLDAGGSEEWKEAMFHFVSVRNTSAKIAEQLMPVIGIRERTADTKLPVSIIQPTGNSITVAWKGAADEFNALGPEGFAIALMQDGSVRRDSFSLYGKGLPQEFALLFTVKGATKIYIPSENISAVEMPTSFQIRLFFQGKNLPLTLLQVFEVDAKSWDSVSLKQLPPHT